jgi:hypothetical protein
MDLSLLIHTCDDYQRFWPGMLFSLDFNWDFKSIPVYWASEEISIHNEIMYMGLTSEQLVLKAIASTNEEKMKKLQIEKTLADLLKKESGKFHGEITKNK